jgi:PiT family inorganic phosphate transporter
VPSFEADVVIFAALSFDFFNGFHDAANSIATVVATRVLSPRMAVIWASFWNFVAFLVFGTAVAATIGTGIIETRAVTLNVVLAGLIGAIVWDIITWYYGIPSSSSHALVGGLGGAAVAFQGMDMLVYGGFAKVLIFIIVSPLVGYVLGVVLMNLCLWVAQFLVGRGRATLNGTNTWFRRIQLFSAAAYSLGHGANDAQKTMGIILAVLIIDGAVGNDAGIGLSIALPAQAAIALGTLAGGWRIISTIGSKITKIQPVGGVAAQTAAAATLFTTAHFGIPVSTTHTITGSIVGVGTTNRFTAVRWGLTNRIVLAWILTLPGSAAVAAVALWVLKVIPADVVVGVGVVAGISWTVVFLRRRRRAAMEAVFAPP